MIENLKIKQELNKLEVKEMMFLNKNVNDGNIKVKIHEIIPAGLEETLKNAFIKAFELVFNKGTEIIEKSFGSVFFAIDRHCNILRLIKNIHPVNDR